MIQPNVLVERWRAQGVRLNPGFASKDLVSRANERGIAATDYLFQWLQVSNGMREADWDDTCLTHWLPFDDWFKIPPSWNMKSTLSQGSWVFADHSIGVHFFSISLAGAAAERGSVFIVNGVRDQLVASSFSEFVERYAAGDDDILYGRRES